MAKKKRRRQKYNVFERADRPGVWRAVVPYRDPITKEYMRKTFDSRDQDKVEGFAKQWLVMIERGISPDAGNITLWTWLEEWLKVYARISLRIKAFDKYESCLRLYIKPSIGSIELSKLTEDDIQSVINELLVSGRSDKTGLSPITVAQTRRYLILALDKAVSKKLVAHNVARDTVAPKVERPHVECLDKVHCSRLLKVDAIPLKSK